MKPDGTFFRGGLFLLLLCLWIVLDADTAAAQCPATGAVGVEDVSTAQGKPYEARVTRTVATYDKDGQKHVKVVKASLFRDSGGRVRIERFFDGTDDPSESVPADITIYDNCGTFIHLSPSQQTAKLRKMTFPPPRGSDQTSCREVDLKNPPYTGPEGKFEYLGHKLVDGVEVRGERTSYYSSAEAKRSGAAPVRVYENWCSISLDTPMGYYTLGDNPKIETSMVVRDITQIEPDSSLFEIPKEYKIVRPEADGPVANPPSHEHGPSR